MPEVPHGAPVVRTPRLLLRPLVERDRAEFVRVHEASREHLAPWSPALPAGTTYDDYFTAELARTGQHEAAGTGCKRAAELLPEEWARMVGERTVARGQEGARATEGMVVQSYNHATRALADRRPLVAFVNLNNISRGAFHCADMGWRAMTEFLGHGLATEAVAGMLDLAFAGPPWGVGLHRVQANIIPGNERSLRLASRVGFRPEGYAKKMLFIAGAWQDHVMHAKLAEEHVLKYVGTKVDG